MRSQHSATVESGQLRLDEPLQIPDQSRVRVTVETTEDWRARYIAGLEQFLQWTQEHPIYGGVYYTREELHERD
jgi:hypothetical protein